MNLDMWLTFVAASTLLLAIPGPTVLLVLSYALTQGRRVAVASALGVATGDLIAMTCSVVGLGALLMTSAVAFAAVKWAGALYLVYLGAKMLFSRPRAHTLLDKPDSTKSSKVYRDLTLVTALNPKSNMFFIAFVPQFISADASFAPQAALLIGTFVSIAAVNSLAYALAANSLRRRITRPSVQAWINRAGGSVLIAMGVLTATLRRSA